MYLARAEDPGLHIGQLHKPLLPLKLQPLTIRLQILPQLFEASAVRMEQGNGNSRIRFANR